MIVSVRLGNAETQWHGGEKGRPGQAHTFTGEIVCNIKHKLVNARLQRAGEQRRIGAAIMIGARFQQQRLSRHR